MKKAPASRRCRALPEAHSKAEAEADAESNSTEKNATQASSAEANSTEANSSGAVLPQCFFAALRLLPSRGGETGQSNVTSSSK